MIYLMRRAFIVLGIALTLILIVWGVYAIFGGRTVKVETPPARQSVFEGESHIICDLHSSQTNGLFNICVYDCGGKYARRDLFKCPRQMEVE